MRVNSSWYFPLSVSFRVGIIGASIGLVLGILAGLQPLLLGLAILAVIVIICFFTYFEQTVLALLILRSSLDIFSAQQVPAAFAIGLDALTILYVILSLLLGRRVITDKFFWFFAAWVAIQSLWVILLPLGGLGLDASYLPVSIREWGRLFSWLMVYLLVMQLKGKISPERFINLLMLSLTAPLTIAFIQIVVPAGILPPILVNQVSIETVSQGEAIRVFGTLGHANGFAKLIFLFIAITWWQLDRFDNKRWFWRLLLCILIFFLVTTKSLFSIGMFGIFIVVRAIQKLSVLRLIGGGLLFALFIGLFTSTEFGLERLNSITNTPLLNPDIDLSQAIMMSEGNSFNWRILQWNYLLQAWQKYPIFGYGLNASPELPIEYNYAHNDYLRALVEGGIVGFISFVVFLAIQLLRIVFLFLKAPPKSNWRSFCSILLAIVTAFFIGMTTDNVWSNTVVYFYWWSILAVAGWDWNRYPNNLIVDRSEKQT